MRLATWATTSLVVLSMTAGLAAGCDARGSTGNVGTGKSDGGTTGKSDAAGTTGTSDSEATGGGTSDSGATTGGTGDQGGTGLPATDKTIPDLQKDPKSAGCDEKKIDNVLDNVRITGAVVLSPKFEAQKADAAKGTEGLDGYFVGTTEGGQYSGIAVTIPQSKSVELAIGDTVDVIGNYIEFYCFSELKATSLTKAGTGTPPAPTTLDPSKLSTPADAEPYESTLIKVENVEVTDVGEFGEYTVTGGLKLAGRFKPGYFAHKGDKLTSVIGVLEYTFSAYKLQPRTKDDLVVGTLAPPATTTIAAVQSHASSMDCTVEKQDGPPTQTNLVVTGIVISPIVEVGKSTLGFYLGTEPSGPSSGLFVTMAKEGAPTLALGDEVKATGSIIEFYCLTEMKTTLVEKVGTKAVPAPLAIEAAELVKGGEKYEGSYVRVSNVSVTDTSHLGDFKEITVTGGLIVSLDDFKLTVKPSKDQKYGAITGAVTYGFKNYKLVPFSDAALEPPK